MAPNEYIDPKAIASAVEGIWNDAQNEAGRFLSKGEPLPSYLVDLLIVCQEASATRDEFGRRYFDIAMQRAG